MDLSLLDHHSKSSSDEIKDTAARSYGCIFCKRGFTSAQALGGHMNIHRKDRNPKTNPNSSSSSSSSSFVPSIMSNDYNYVSYNYPPNYNYRPPFYHEPYVGLPVSARTAYYSFPASQEVRSTLMEAADDDEDGRVINQGFSDNEGLVWGLTLNLQAGPLRIHGGGDAAVLSEEDDVDLELRLGYA